MDDKRLEICTLHNEIIVDRHFAYALLCGLSELHGRLCTRIGECGDMQEATNLAAQLEDIVHMHNDVELVAAKMDERNPQLLEV